MSRYHTTQSVNVDEALDRLRRRNLNGIAFASLFHQKRGAIKFRNRRAVMNERKQSPWLKALCGSAAAAIVGAGGGAAIAAFLQAVASGPFSIFDGAWLGTAFAVPIGTVIGFVSSTFERVGPIRGDAATR